MALSLVPENIAVEDFTELGIYLDEPVKSYSSGMNSRLSFAISMAVDFGFGDDKVASCV